VVRVAVALFDPAMTVSEGKVRPQPIRAIQSRWGGRPPAGIDVPKWWC
jgi:hypothetical protein